MTTSMNDDELDDSGIERLEEFLNSFDTPEKWSIVPIELVAPPMIEEALGYTGDRRYVAFYVSLRTFEFGVDDGEFHPSDMSAWKEFTIHPLVAAFLDYPSREGYWLLLDRGNRPERRLYVGVPTKVRMFIDATVHIAQTLRNGNPDQDEIGIPVSNSGRNISDVRQKLRAWLDKELEKPASQYRLGCWHDKYDRFADAVIAFESAAKIDAELASKPEFNRRMAELYFRLQRHSDAIKAYQRVLEIQPANERAIWGLALAYVAEGYIEEAIASFKQHTQLQPESAESHSGLGMALAMTKRYPEAVKAYAEAVRLDPNDPNLRSDLAAMYALAGDITSAFREYRAAQSLGLDKGKESELLKLL
jgi:tetratricopeptide (TPR) repeat protein